MGKCLGQFLVVVESGKISFSVSHDLLLVCVFSGISADCLKKTQKYLVPASLMLISLFNDIILNGISLCFGAEVGHTMT